MTITKSGVTATTTLNSGLGNTAFNSISETWPANETRAGLSVAISSAMFAGLTASARAFSTGIETAFSNALSQSALSNGSAYIQQVGKIDSMKMQESAIEMLSFSSLRPGWDGPNSSAPSKNAISDAYAFIQRLPVYNEMPEPTVYAGGEVGWYWSKGDDVVSVVFTGQGRYAYYGKVRGEIVRSPSRQYGKFIPVDLSVALNNL